MNSAFLGWRVSARAAGESRPSLVNVWHVIIERRDIVQRDFSHFQSLDYCLGVIPSEIQMKSPITPLIGRVFTPEFLRRLVRVAGHFRNI